jgi:glycerol-3-phosphate dehydrogenase subunit C
VLEHLGFEVIIPPQACCGLPLQSNGLFDAARRQAKENVANLLPFAQAGIPIIGTSTSCTLALRHDYSEILGMKDEATLEVAGRIRDLFEFLAYDHRARLDDLEFAPLPRQVVYHPPCQLKAHGMGTPAQRLLERIPQLSIQLSQMECCGVAGTYGIKSERYSVAARVGHDLFDLVKDADPDLVVTDSETCRWWISHHTGKECMHPLELVHRSLMPGSSAAAPPEPGGTGFDLNS